MEEFRINHIIFFSTGVTFVELQTMPITETMEKTMNDYGDRKLMMEK
ncbi:hypothetical protein ACX9YW_09105 [Pseudoneobacillus sp. C159]